MDVSIIIVNYHSANLVADCINSIFEKTTMISYEIIVVDNNSGDGSVEFLENVFGNKIKIIASDINLGFGKANNLGAHYAKGEYLFLLNPDTILINNAIFILCDYLKKHDTVGVVGGNLYSPEMKATPSYCMFFDDLKSEKRQASWGNLIIKKVGQKLNDKLHANTKPFAHEFNYSNENKKVSYIFGADMMLKHSLFDNVGGFDSDFFMYAEEEELSWRITQSGYSIMSIPDAKIIHLEGATVKKENQFSSRQFKMRMNGAMTYYKKRFGLDGVNEFYRLRLLRYNRLIKIAKLQRKSLDGFAPSIQKQCLQEVYKDFISEQE